MIQKKHRTKGNETLRKRLKGLLKNIKSGDEILTNSVVDILSKENKNYSINAQRAANLLRETGLVRRLKDGVWLKI